MSDYKTFSTERLFLRPTNLQDADFILALVNTPKWIQHIGDRKVYTLEDAKNYIQTKMLPQLEQLGYGNYTIIRKSDGVKLGSCGLYDREGLEINDIGFALLPNYEGQGYAYEAARMLMSGAQQDFGVQAISAITTEENISSQKLIEKLGLKFLKIIHLPTDPVPLMYYEIKFNNSNSFNL